MLPILLAQASTPGPVRDGAVVSDAPVSTAVSVLQGPRNVKVVESKEVDGTSSFAVPVTSSQVKSVQVLDLDMLLLLDNGDGILLREGAFLAATNAVQKVTFSNGSQIPVSEFLSQVGVMKPSEAASFRISSTELTLVNNEPRGGQGLNLGKGDDDAQKGPAVEEVTQLLQSLQNAKLSDAPVAEQRITPLKISDSLAEPVVLRPASSPGTEFTSNNQNTSNLTALKTPSLTGAVDPKVSGVELVDSTKTFASTTFDKMVGTQQLAVKVQANANSVAPPEASTNPDRAFALLNLDAPTNATRMKVQLSTFGSETATDLPDSLGFTLNGQSINKATTVTVSVPVADNKMQLPVTWKLADGDVTPHKFQMLVQYLDATGAIISGVDQTLTFQYRSINEVNQVYELDDNGNPILQLPANGFNYNITGRDTDDKIQAGDALGDSYTRIQNVVGSNFHDQLLGDAQNNLILGGQGNDTLAVTVNLAEASLNAGDDGQGDTLTSIEGVIGSQFDDQLTGNELVNKLYGGGGNDILTGGAGADTLSGGEGTDTAAYKGAISGVKASLTQPSANTGDAQGDVLLSIENLTGSALADTLEGNAGSNVLSGSGGDDVLVGRGGGDHYHGGDGSDTADYTDALDKVVINLAYQENNAGAAAGDSLQSIERVADSGVDVVSYEGINTPVRVSLFTGGTNNATAGQQGSTETFSGIENLRATSGSTDAVGDAFASVEVFVGSQWSDTFLASTASTWIRGGDTGATRVTDTVDYSASEISGDGSGADVDLARDNQTSASVTVAGGRQGTLWAKGDVFSNLQKVIGTAKDDTFWAGGAPMAIDGGADTLSGSNTVSFEASTSAGVSASLMSSPGITLTGWAVNKTYTNIQNLTGTTLADVLEGDAKNNVLSGGAGDDVFKGTLGLDTLIGGAGNDTADFSSVTTALNMSLANGTGLTIRMDSVVGATFDAAGDTFAADIEGVIGTRFADSLYGRSTFEFLQGGAGDDTLYGSLGADILEGNAGTNTADYSASTAVTINLLDGTAELGGFAEGDLLLNIQHINTTGDSFVMDAGSGTDTLKLLALGSSWTLDTSTIVDSKFVGFEKLDLSGNGSQNLILTAQGIQALVDPGSSALRLTLILDSGDTYSAGTSNSLAQGAGNFTLTGGGFSASVNIVYVSGT
eukprot:gene1268-1241_t